MMCGTACGDDGGSVVVGGGDECVDDSSACVAPCNRSLVDSARPRADQCTASGPESFRDRSRRLPRRLSRRASPSAPPSVERRLRPTDRSTGRRLTCAALSSNAPVLSLAPLFVATIVSLQRINNGDLARTHRDAASSLRCAAPSTATRSVGSRRERSRTLSRLDATQRPSPWSACVRQPRRASSCSQRTCIAPCSRVPARCNQTTFTAQHTRQHRPPDNIRSTS